MAAPVNLFNFKKMFNDYCEYVRDNPEKITQIEGAIRSCSYIVAGFIGDSEVLSELLYSAASLLRLVNDVIIKRAKNIIPRVTISVEKMKTMLTAIEYVEVLVELTADRYGTTVKWAIVSIIEIARICLRVILLLKYKSGILPSPPIVPYIRVEEGERNYFGEMTKPAASTVTLKRSGRKIRTLESSPPAGFRTWELPQSRDPTSGTDNENSQNSGTSLCIQRQVAEGLHILRPAVHLLSMYKYGIKSWKPWLLACGVDVTSLLLMNTSEGLTASEQNEMRRRTIIMLFYLLRSPFYDRYSKTKIILFLNLMADIIPGLGLLIKPLLSYLPTWQRIYFYTWAQ